MVLLTIRREARDLKVLMFHHLSYWQSSILRIFRVKGTCTIYVKKAEETHEKQLLGTFYISDGLYESRKATVYVAAKSDYKASYFYMEMAKIREVGRRISSWNSLPLVSNILRLL